MNLDDLLGGVASAAGRGACPICNATSERGGLVVFVGQPPPECPGCGRPPAMALPHNCRDESERLVYWPLESAP